MSTSRRNWLSTGDLARLTGYTRRHVLRLTEFDGWRIGSAGKHNRFKDVPDLRDFCRNIRRMLSFPPDKKLGNRFEQMHTADLYEVAQAQARRRAKLECADVPTTIQRRPALPTPRR
jgi:hypothetical protein